MRQRLRLEYSGVPTVCSSGLRNSNYSTSWRWRKVATIAVFMLIVLFKLRLLCVASIRIGLTLLFGNSGRYACFTQGIFVLALDVYRAPEATSLVKAKCTSNVECFRASSVLIIAAQNVCHITRGRLGTRVVVSFRARAEESRGGWVGSSVYQHASSLPTL